MSKEAIEKNEPKAKYRTKEERLLNSKEKKKGRPAELFMPVEAGTVNPRSIVYLRVASDAEGIRDESDAKAVMHEKNIIGTVVIMRRVGLPLCRQPQTVMSFVTPATDDPDNQEVK